MDQIILVIITCLIGFFSTFIVFDFMSKFGRIIYRPKYIYILSYITFTILLFIIGMITNTSVNILASLIGSVIIGHYLYNNTKIYILYYSMFIVILTIFQIIVSFVYSIFYSNGLINFFNIDMIQISSGIIIQFASLSASRLFINWFKNKSIDKLNNIQLFNFLILPIFSVFYIITLLIYMETFSQFRDSMLLIINLASIIILNIFITDIFQSISKNNEMKNKLALYDQQANIQHNYYNNLESKYQNSRKLIHDIKNHVQTMESLYVENKNEQSATYKKDLYDMFSNLEQKKYTENKVLNIIINDKIKKAEEFEVCINCKIGDINLEKIRDYEGTLKITFDEQHFKVNIVIPNN